MDYSGPVPILRPKIADYNRIIEFVKGVLRSYSVFSHFNTVRILIESNLCGLQDLTKQRQSFHHGSARISHRRSENKILQQYRSDANMQSVFSLAKSSIILKILSSNSIHIYSCTHITILTKKWANFIPHHNLKSIFSKFFLL